MSQGSFFKARLVTDTRDGSIYVLKSCSIQEGKFADRDYIDSTEFKMLLVAIKDASCRQLSPLADVVRTKNHVHLVYPFAAGGPLMNTTVGRPNTPQQPDGYFCEDEARHYFQQLITGMMSLQKKEGRDDSGQQRPGISVQQVQQSSVQLFHGDLRLDDLLLDKVAPPEYIPVTNATRSRKPNLQINGVGMMPLRLHAGVEPRAASGLQHLVAPELLNIQPPITVETFAVADVWSCGVALYVMVTGAFPFDDPDPEKLTEKICAGEFNFPGDDIRLSPGPRGVKHLIANMLVCNPARRYTFENVTKHPWFEIRLDKRLTSASSNVHNRRSSVAFNPVQQQTISLLLPEAPSQAASSAAL